MSKTTSPSSPEARSESSPLDPRLAHIPPHRQHHYRTVGDVLDEHHVRLNENLGKIADRVNRSVLARRWFLSTSAALLGMTVAGELAVRVMRSGASAGAGQPLEALSPAATQALDQIDPVEANPTITLIMSYACLHCFRLDAALQTWLDANRPDAIQTHNAQPRRPVVVRRRYAALATEPRVDAFDGAPLTAELFAVIERFGGQRAQSGHHQVMNLIHENRMDYESPRDVAKIIDRLGMTPRDFAQRAAEVRADQTIPRYAAVNRAVDVRQRGVPLIVVNNRTVTSPSLAGGYEQAVSVMQDLLRQG